MQKEWLCFGRQQINVKDGISKPDFLDKANVTVLLHDITGGK